PNGKEIFYTLAPGISLEEGRNALSSKAEASIPNICDCLAQNLQVFDFIFKAFNNDFLEYPNHHEGTNRELIFWHFSSLNAIKEVTTFLISLALDNKKINRPIMLLVRVWLLQKPIKLINYMIITSRSYPRG
ncbi:hypothetical protein ACJX0J_030537, partial [Zea mays]